MAPSSHNSARHDDNNVSPASRSPIEWILFAMDLNHVASIKNVDKDDIDAWDE